MQPGDRKVGRKIGAVRRHKHGRAFHIGLVDVRHLFRRRDEEEMRPVHRWVGWIGVDRGEPNLVFLDFGIVQRLLIVEVAGDFHPRRESFG